MFFMGGMTMGYLEPPVPASKQQTCATLADEKDRRQLPEREGAPSKNGAVERRTLWGLRILC